jgi:hypothetical protein
MINKRSRMIPQPIPVQEQPRPKPNLFCNQSNSQFNINNLIKHEKQPGLVFISSSNVVIAAISSTFIYAYEIDGIAFH